MEQSENKREELAATQTEAAVSAQPEAEEKQELSREEILAISRKENKRGDEREARSMQAAMQLAYSVGLMVVGVVQLVDVCLDQQIPFELYMIYMAMTATMALYCGIKMTRLKAFFLTVGVIIGVCFIGTTVAWILRLCGVAL